MLNKTFDDIELISLLVCQVPEYVVTLVCQVPEYVVTRVSGASLCGDSRRCIISRPNGRVCSRLYLGSRTTPDRTS